MNAQTEDTIRILHVCQWTLCKYSTLARPYRGALIRAITREIEYLEAMKNLAPQIIQCSECRGSGVFETDPSGAFHLDCPACNGRGEIAALVPEAEVRK